MQPPRWKVLAAFAALYLIWGSTYLAIRFAIETLPPFLMAGARFLIAGALLYAWTRGSGTAPAAERRHWGAATVMGGLLLLGGNGAVVWAEEVVASGVVALLVAMVPIWMVLMDWAQGTGGRPTGKLWFGMALGLGGLALLLGPDALRGWGSGDEAGGGLIDPVRAGAVVLGSLSWAAGSIYSRRAELPRSPLLATAMQMLAGGALLAGAGLLFGEAGRIDLAGTSLRSGLALVYLILVGSIVGYTAYVWLLRVSTPARVSTYAFVNPLVAVFLGWLLAGEPLTPRIAAAAGVIVVGVAVITTSRTHPARRGLGPPHSGGEIAGTFGNGPSER